MRIIIFSFAALFFGYSTASATVSCDPDEVFQESMIPSVGLRLQIDGKGISSHGDRANHVAISCKTPGGKECRQATRCGSGDRFSVVSLGKRTWPDGVSTFPMITNIAYEECRMGQEEAVARKVPWAGLRLGFGIHPFIPYAIVRDTLASAHGIPSCRRDDYGMTAVFVLPVGNEQILHQYLLIDVLIGGPVPADALRLSITKAGYVVSKGTRSWRIQRTRSGELNGRALQARLRRIGRGKPLTHVHVSARATDPWKDVRETLAAVRVGKVTLTPELPIWGGSYTKKGAAQILTHRISLAI